MTVRDAGTYQPEQWRYFLSETEETLKILAKTWCISDQQGESHAVLGNYDPREKGKAKVAQRLCDQHIMEYTKCSQGRPNCPDCLRIKRLMLELLPIYPKELDDEREDDNYGAQRDSSDGLGQHETLPIAK
jgi:hypothetical protein